MIPSYTHGVSTKPLIGATIGDFLDRIATEFASNEALVSVFEDTRSTYAQFREEVDRCARALMRHGIQKGDRVGIWSTNCAAWVIVQFATAKIGAILVNINPAYRSHELEYALNQSECNLLLHGEGFKDANYAEIIQQVRTKAKLPHLRGVLFLRDWERLLEKSNQVNPDQLAERQT